MLFGYGERRSESLCSYRIPEYTKLEYIKVCEFNCQVAVQLLDTHDGRKLDLHICGFLKELERSFNWAVYWHDFAKCESRQSDPTCSPFTTMTRIS